MSALSDHLGRLLNWLGSIGLHPPSQDMRIVEIGSGIGTPHVRREALLRPLEYEARFEELLQTGYPWLNRPAMAFMMAYWSWLSKSPVQGRSLRDTPRR
jgi:hypothetical protein